MTDAELAEIEARANKATTAPWTVEADNYSGHNWLVGMVAVHLGASCLDNSCYFVTTDHVHASDLEGDARTDAEFIAHARTDIPALLAEVKRERARAEAAEAKLDAMPVTAIHTVTYSAETPHQRERLAVMRWLAEVRP